MEERGVHTAKVLGVFGCARSLLHKKKFEKSELLRVLLRASETTITTQNLA